MPQHRAMATRKPRKRAVPEGSAPEPVDDSLDALRDAAIGCKRCPLWKPASRTVFGEGPDDARVLVVGEQPGDAEDLSGHPFVGPAGKLFDRALEELGIDRSRLYVTNAVKHFKFERRGKARLHKSPNPSEQRACRLWLEGEIDRIRPGIIVCLGASAAHGRNFPTAPEPSRPCIHRRYCGSAIPRRARAPIGISSPTWDCYRTLER